eukprot:GFUD01043681.1.p1 GENE.GFUD01043681.1~~GFUD01043681.1.p1  ORF type:complete len:237 (+),score=22.13 GFUD01043681.1:181-891(+)
MLPMATLLLHVSLSLPIALSAYIGDTPPFPNSQTNLPFHRNEDVYSSSEDIALTVNAADSKLVYDLLGPEEMVSDRQWARYQPFPPHSGVLLYNFAPCGVGLPHVHPYADELNYAMMDNEVDVGYVAANGSIILVKTTTGKGFNYFIPRGTIHWIINNSCTKSHTSIQFLNGPKITTVRPDIQLGSIPKEILWASMGAELGNRIAEWATEEPSPTQSICPRCMEMCGLTMGGPLDK